MIHLVTFASDDYMISARACVDSAYRVGANSHALFTPGNIRHWEATAETVKRNALFEATRGCGFWAFKPLILEATMRDRSDGDLITYADAGLEFIEPVQTVIDLMDQDIWLFGNEHLHAHWCKADIVEAIWPLDTSNDSVGATVVGAMVRGIDSNNDEEMEWARFGKQVQASVIFFRVNDYTRAFVKEWLDWCLFENGRLIDDSPSRLPNHSEFKENRHDQAILTTMAYRDGIKLHEWFVKYEGYTPGRMTGYSRELERPVVFHHRRRNHEWEGRAA